MEEQLVQLLAATQSTAQGPRQQAEESLQQLHANEALPLSLVSIAANTSVNLSVRQAALLNLKNYVLAGWSQEFDEFKNDIPLNDETKSRVRSSLLELSTTEGVDRKVQTAASYVVSKIASADYPEQWPDLLQIVLGILQSNPSDARLHGTLKVLNELVEDGLDESQFFPSAQELVNSIHTVAVNEQRRPKLRALAVRILKECFNTLQVMLEDRKAEIKTFVDQSMTAWFDLLLNIINTQLPEHPDGWDDSEDGPVERYRGLVALKIQVSRVLITIRTQFPFVLSPRSTVLFSAIWDELTRLQPTYQATFVEDDVVTSLTRLEDADALPYSLDFLVLEDLDFLQGCLRAPPVRKELERQLETQSGQDSWLVGYVRLITAYAQITVEDQSMWELDVNVFLAEETSVTANYTARISCGDLVIKLAEWLREKMLESLALQTEEHFNRSDEGAWRQQEASLYLLEQTLGDWQDSDHKVSRLLSDRFLTLAGAAKQHTNSFLRARGYMVISTLLRGAEDSARSQAVEYMQTNLQAIHGDSSEIVQVTCVRAIQNYLQVLPPQSTLPLQTPIISALSAWLSSKDTTELAESDELLFTLVESLRDVITLDTRVCLTGDALNILFSVVSTGAVDSFQITNLVSETFEEICSTISPLGSEPYTQLCQKVLPSITGAFDVGKMTEESALSSLAAELLASLTSHAPTPLPPGFVAAVMPKLSSFLLNSTDEELLKSCTTALQNILVHDAPQLLSDTQPTGGINTSPSSLAPGKPGLEIVLSIVDRLLSPTLGSDIASQEVGSLAAALIEHVGPQQLGQYLVPLLTGVAVRISTAEQTALIQSLIMVFARLAVHHSAREVVDFVASVSVPDPNNPAASRPGLEVVFPVWLNDATPVLAGYSDIRLNVVALTRLFELGDPRLNVIQCKGDMIVTAENSGRIMTRSRAKAAPQAEQYASVPVPVKIVKLLIDELASATAAINPSTPGLSKITSATDGTGEDSGGSDWEDDLGEDELLKFAAEEPGSAKSGADGETLSYLEGWFRQIGQRGLLGSVGEFLNEGERELLLRMA